MRTALPTHEPLESVLSPLLTAREAGRYLHLNARTLANWRALGKGPRFIRSGSRALYRQSELERWLDAQTFAHTAQERSRRHRDRQ